MLIQDLHFDCLNWQDTADLFQELPSGFRVFDNEMAKSRDVLPHSRRYCPGNIPQTKRGRNEIKYPAVHTTSMPSCASMSTSATSGSPISALGSSLTIRSINAIPNP